jgi:hypothetical protein
MKKAKDLLARVLVFASRVDLFMMNSFLAKNRWEAWAQENSSGYLVERRGSGQLAEKKKG